MPNKVLILCGAAVLSLAGTATPVFAWTHHHRMTSAMHGPSTPAERAQTADLNRQQLAQAENAVAGSMAGNSATGQGTAVSTTSPGTATQQNGLTTEPTSYQGPGGSNGTSGSMSGSSTTTNGIGAGVGEDQNVGAPKGTAPATLQDNPGGTVTPPPTNPSSTPR